MLADVKESLELLNSAAQLLSVQGETGSACQQAMAEAEKLLEETRQEEQHSQGLLNAAREVEEAAYAAMQVAEGVMLAAEANLAAALAAEAAALSSMNPVAAIAAAERVYAAERAYERAKQAYEFARQAYEAAKAHRELLEKRCEMAKQAVALAQAMTAKLQASCAKCQAQILPLVEQGVSRIRSAFEELQKYHAETSTVSAPALNLSAAKTPTIQNPTEKNFSAWKNYQPEIGAPVSVPELNSRLNPPMRGLLQNLYETDENFRRQIDTCRANLSANRAETERQIKSNIAGRLAEEIVKGALSPYGKLSATQVRHDLPDDSYTKTDFVLRDLKVPLIFGKGTGMGVREGGSLAVEVKSGRESYLERELEHIKKQAQGHAEYDASWVICTRDIRNVRAEADFRAAIRNAGSPPIGMLPYKDEIDAACLNFVREGISDG